MIVIFSQHRSGSTLLKNILDSSRQINMLDDETNIHELNKFNTVYVYSILSYFLRIKIKINTKNIHGTFWKKFYKKKYIIFNSYETGLEKFYNNLIGNCFEKSDSIKGIKYPAHISFKSKWTKYFPNSKSIILKRSPYAIISSKLNDSSSKRRMKKMLFFSFFYKIITIIYFSLEYRFYFKKVNNSTKQIVVFYEDIVLNPEILLLKISKFLNIKNDFKINSITGKKSSYLDKNKKGLSNHSIDKWKKHLNNFEICLIKFITGE